MECYKVDGARVNRSGESIRFYDGEKGLPVSTIGQKLHDIRDRAGY